MTTTERLNTLNIKLKEVTAEHDGLIRLAQKEYTDELHEQNIQLVDKK